MSSFPSSSSPSSSPSIFHRSLSDIRALVAQFESSGQDVSSWCQVHGLKPATLRWYRKRVRAVPPCGFIALRPSLGSPVRERVLVLELSGGARVTGLGVADVVALVRACAGEVSS